MIFEKKLDKKHRSKRTGENPYYMSEETRSVYRSDQENEEDESIEEDAIQDYIEKNLARNQEEW